MPPETPAEEVSPRKLRVTAIVAVIIVTLTVISGLVIRKSDDKQLRDWTDDQAIPTVAILKPEKRGDVATLDLPGRLEAFSNASIHARVSGYLKSWKVDIGKSVKAGQLLAEIETPDLDQELIQGKPISSVQRRLRHSPKSPQNAGNCCWIPNMYRSTQLTKKMAISGPSGHWRNPLGRMSTA